MCGIFGFVTQRPEAARRLDAGAALKALAHRGPDGSGTFAGQAGVTVCELAHSRLAIIDLSERGRQPMLSADGRYVITYNGEVYNHREIRLELERAGRRLRSTSDTEAILEAYATWGPDCLARLRGMFAFGVWDNKSGELFLARDRLGIKPLYVASSDGTLAFGSEIRALLAAKAVEPKLSPEGLHSYLEWGSVAEPRTILAGVDMLAPGTHLTWRDGRSTVRSYWQLPAGPPSCDSFDQAVERVTPVLREAVELRLVSDVPVGIFLSGGVDSSIITAIASETSPRRLHTFTVAFDEAAMNEGEHAAAIARRFRCEHHHILLRHERLQNELDEAVDALDQPSTDGTNTFFVAKAVRAAGISVALSGLGGDELFAGYHYFRQFPAARRLAGSLPTSISALLDPIVAYTAFRGLPRWAPKLAELAAGPAGVASAYAALRGMFTRSQRAQLLPGIPMERSAHVELPPLDGRSDNTNLFSQLELSNYLRNTLLRDTDAMSMAHALEVRVPLLDHRLIETVLSVAGRLKLPTDMNKPLLVRSGPPIPSHATNRKKMGFTLPFDEWLRGPLRPRMDALLGGSAVRSLGFLSVGAVQSMWSAFLARDSRVTFSRIWCIATLAAWCERNGAML